MEKNPGPADIGYNSFPFTTRLLTECEIMTMPTGNINVHDATEMWEIRHIFVKNQEQYWIIQEVPITS